MLPQNFKKTLPQPHLNALENSSHNLTLTPTFNPHFRTESLAHGANQFGERFRWSNSDKNEHHF